MSNQNFKIKKGIVIADNYVIVDETQTLIPAGDLTTTATDLVTAINEHETDIGDVSTLTTTATDLSAAVNEHDAEIGDVSTLTTTATDLSAAVNEHDAEIGDLSNLNTTATDLVSAINEVDGEKSFDSIVAADGSGDYTDIMDAVDAGHTKLLIRDGDYVLDRSHATSFPATESNTVVLQGQGTVNVDLEGNYIFGFDGTNPQITEYTLTNVTYDPSIRRLTFDANPTVVTDLTFDVDKLMLGTRYFADNGFGEFLIWDLDTVGNTWIEFYEDLPIRDSGTIASLKVTKVPDVGTPMSNIYVDNINFNLTGAGSPVYFERDNIFRDIIYSNCQINGQMYNFFWDTWVYVQNAQFDDCIFNNIVNSVEDVYFPYGSIVNDCTFTRCRIYDDVWSPKEYNNCTFRSCESNISFFGQGNVISNGAAVYDRPLLRFNSCVWSGNLGNGFIDNNLTHVDPVFAFNGCSGTAYDSLNNAYNMSVLGDNPMTILTAAATQNIGTYSTPEQFYLYPTDAVEATQTLVIQPLSETLGTRITVKDTTGNASNTYKIIVTSTVATFDGAASFEINVPYGSSTFVYNGTEWNVL